MFEEFFDGRRVLVTGVAGVKGAWLALELLEAGAIVIGVDSASPEPDSNYTAASLGGRIQYVQGDITDLAKIEELAGKVDCVFHLAAVALVGEAQANPLAAYRNNTWGTAVVLEAVRRSPSVRYAVFVTTDKVYRPNNGDPWREGDPLGASGPYAVSKSSSESIIADYYSTYLQPAGKRLGIGRGGNVLIGGDLHSSRRIPGSGRIFVDCYDALIEGRSPEIFQPAYTRPYTYGLDIISGYMNLMSRLDCDGVDGEAFNFGPHERYGVSNGLLATKICELWGGDTHWTRGAARDEPFVNQSLNWDKSRERLLWEPAFTLYEGLRETTRWYQEWARWRKDAREGGLKELNASLIRDHREAAARLGIRWALGASNAAPSGSGLPLS